jgi:hypothetical protein
MKLAQTVRQVTDVTEEDLEKSEGEDVDWLVRLLDLVGCTELRLSLSKDAAGDPSYSIGRVVDSFTPAVKTRTRRMFWIKSVYSCRGLCMYSSVQVSHSPLGTPPYPSVISRGVGGGCPRMRRTQRFLFVSLPCNQKDFRVQNFLKLK